MKSKFSNLEKSLFEETKKIQDKFERAEKIFSDTSPQYNKIQLKQQTDLVVREGISLPKEEAQKIENIRDKISQAGFYPTKSEIFRAGILALESMEVEKIRSLIKTLEKLKKGRKKV